MVEPNADTPRVTATVVYGANRLENTEFVGMTIGELREYIAEQFNLPPVAHPFVNGVAVSEDYRIEAKNSVEFMKESGQKG